MDSFYDAPRRPPQPMAREVFTATTVVPEISVLCPSNTPRNAFTPYNQWKKDATANNVLLTNKENFNGPFQSTQNNSILKKQVRFESPVLNQRPLEGNEPFLNKNGQNLSENHVENERKHNPHNQGRIVSSFEQIYMANIPNRQLDLSVIDLPKRIYENDSKKDCLEANLEGNEDNNQPTDKEQPKTYREFLEGQKIENKIVLNDSVTDIFNYKRNLTPKVVKNVDKLGAEASAKNLNNQYSPAFGQNVFQPLQELKQVQNEINGKKEKVQWGQPFHHVSEAISRRKSPVSYKNTNNAQDVEMIRGVGRGTPQKNWFPPLTDGHDNRQGKILIEGDRNYSKNTPQEAGNHSETNDFFNRSKSKNTPNKKCITMAEDTNPAMQKRQVDNGCQTLPSALSYNCKSPHIHKTINPSVDSQKNCECSQASSDLSNCKNNSLKKRSDDDLSVKDLLKIIAQQSQQISQQNEQLLLLQKQVSMLIGQRNENEYPRQKSIQGGQEGNCYQQDKNCYNRPRHCCCQEQLGEQRQGSFLGPIKENMKNVQDRCITSTQHESYEGVKKKREATPKNKNNIPNFSIGLTTSFEVSFKRPHANGNQNDFMQPLPDFNQYKSPKIQEITETGSTASEINGQDFQKRHENDNREIVVDESMVFKEPIRVRESCPSPEPSIKINMNDFEDSESEDDLAPSEIGPSFYRNLMVQVNKILQKAQIETTEDVAYNFKGQHLKQNTLLKVKEATLKHLKRIGVEVQNSDDSSQSSGSFDGTDSKSYNQDDISFAVKQLLMKYLPADHLAKVAYKEAQTINPVMLTPKEKIGAIKTRPDFSFATVQYMKKYNLIANNQKDFCQPTKQNQPESPKILDITKLKQQPKLL